MKVEGKEQVIFGLVSLLVACGRILIVVCLEAPVLHPLV